jgi:hypothetical protein
MFQDQGGRVADDERAVMPAAIGPAAFEDFARIAGTEVLPY